VLLSALVGASLLAAAASTSAWARPEDQCAELGSSGDICVDRETLLIAGSALADTEAALLIIGHAKAGNRRCGWARPVSRSASERGHGERSMTPADPSARPKCWYPEP